MKRPRDSQRTALYRWEWALKAKFPSLATKLTLEECGALIRRVWDDYRPAQTPPVLQDGRGRTHACGSRRRISLPVWARCPIVVLHELAHALDTVSGGAHHGPDFARIFLDLIAQYTDAPVREVKSMAVHQKPRRVRFASVAAARQPKVSQEWKEWKRLADDVTELYRKLKEIEPAKYQRSDR